MTDRVEALIDAWPEPQRSIARRLRQVMLEAEPALTESVKWRSPTFALDRNLCNIMCHSHHVNLQLFDGAALPDPQRRLHGTGKGMRHISYRSVDDVDAEAVADYVRRAASLQRK